MKHAHTHTLTCEVQPRLTLKGHANTERLMQTAKCTHTHNQRWTHSQKKEGHPVRGHPVSGITTETRWHGNKDYVTTDHKAETEKCSLNEPDNFSGSSVSSVHHI